MINFETSEKIKVCVYGEELKDVPVVYLPMVFDDGEKVWNECKKINCKPFILVAISNFNWNDYLTPWRIPPIYKNDEESKGMADDFLNILSSEILPLVNSFIKNSGSYNIIAGYSLAGLFAVYSIFKTTLFDKVVSASGSLWFPNFCDFVFKNKMKKIPKSIYFSLGDKEANTKNIYLRCVDENTQKIYNYFKSKNILTTFEMNIGNHFANTINRTARGIKWVLETPGRLYE